MESFEIYIRKLRETDYLYSWKWRNNPRIWKYTGSDPSKYGVTPEIEKKWLIKVLQEKDSERFAICLKRNDEVVGIVDLRNIDFNEQTAEFNIFIGEEGVWGRGYGFKATQQMLNYAKNNLHLKTIFLYVSELNQAAVRIYLKLGFKFTNIFVKKNVQMRKMFLDLDHCKLSNA